MITRTRPAPAPLPPVKMRTVPVTEIYVRFPGEHFVHQYLDEAKGDHYRFVENGSVGMIHITYGSHPDDKNVINLDHAYWWSVQRKTRLVPDVFVPGQSREEGNG